MRGGEAVADLFDQLRPFLLSRFALAGLSGTTTPDPGTPSGPVDAGSDPDTDPLAVPAILPDSAILPWLERRLALGVRAAGRVGQAAQALKAVQAA